MRFLLPAAHLLCLLLTITSSTAQHTNNVAPTCETFQRATDFRPADWIWTPEMSGGSTARVTRPFRRMLTAPAGKQFAFAHFLLVADNGIDLYVNGIQIGQTPGLGLSTHFAVVLEPRCPNVISVFGDNRGGGSAGLLMNIKVTYTDGSAETILSDTSWKTLSANLPTGADWFSPTFDDSQWIPAYVVATHDQCVAWQAPCPARAWGTASLALPATLNQPLTCISARYDCVPSNPTCGEHAQATKFEPANWIYTKEMAAGTVPKGSRAFRKVIASPPGKTAVAADILIAVNDDLTFFVNGENIGSFTTTSKRYPIVLNPCLNVFAIHVTNRGVVEGWIAKITITFSDGTQTVVITDESWRTSGTSNIATGWEEVGFDDSNWGTSFVTTRAPYFSGMPTVPAVTPNAAGGCIGSLTPCPYCLPTETESKECQLVPETFCSPAGHNFLTAVPGEGCVCRDVETEGWCGAPQEGYGNCLQDSDLNAKCVINNVSTEGSTQACELTPSTGDTCGQCGPQRLSIGGDCAGPGKSLYALPGNGGCKCLSATQSPVEGATKCDAPQNGSGGCAYVQGSPAFCTSACDDGFVNNQALNECVSLSSCGISSSV